jgi:hypothetical protein
VQAPRSFAAAQDDKKIYFEEGNMIFKGKVKITMYADCGWWDNDIIDYEVDCDDVSKIESAITEKYESLAYAHHGQIGCPHGCVTGIVVHLDGEE